MFIVPNSNSQITTYSKKAKAPIPSNTSFFDYEYSYNVNSKDEIVGTNTFSVVYHPTPPERHIFRSATLRTGRETLKITYDPKNRGNRTITYANNVQHWYYDLAALKWIKRMNDELYGTYTIKTVNWRIEGVFKFPIGWDSFNGGCTYIMGTANSGELPEGKSLMFGFYDFDDKKIKKYTDIDLIASEKNVGKSKGTIELADYVALLEDEKLKSFFQKHFLEDEYDKMTIVKLRFPATLDNYFICKGPLTKNDLSVYIGLPKIQINKDDGAIAKKQKAEETKRLTQELKHKTYSKRLDSIVSDYNRKLLQNPYNLKRKTLNYFGLPNDDEIEENFHKESEQLKVDYDALQKEVETNLMWESPLKYCEIFYSQNIEKKEEADKKYRECKCNYPDRNTFDIDFIRQIKMKCDCVDREFVKFQNLFKDISEFRAYFDQGDNVLQEEINIRKFMINESTIRTLNFSKIEDVTKEYVDTIVKLFKFKPSYSRVIGFVVATNNRLNKEWNKNGKYFSDKIDFYEAYISGKYKRILKEKKR